ncbi:MAG: tyrosine-type recombinase/integrase, partial [Chloroflexi bacterium]|nr:tyrosine-type recombinase/integrase [Chloroflexota bacterium]
MDTNELRDWWLLSLESEGAAKDTLRTYREHTDWFLRHLQDNSLSPFTVRRFLADYRQGHAPASLRTVFISVRAFLRFGVREGLLEESILAGLRPPKRVEAPKQIYSQGQLAAMFRALEADRSPLGLRDHAICSVLLDGGLRSSEACALTLSALEDGALLVGPSKSGRMRMVPLGQRGQRAINRYLATGRPGLRPQCENVFVGRDGTPISRNTIRQALSRLSRRLGFPVSAHRFRHTFTTVLLRKGCDLETLRRLGGWADYTMLMTYTHLA